MSKVIGRPFQPGNSFGRGRPKGGKNKGTLLAQKLLGDYAEPLMRRCVGDALKGDRNAMKLLVPRLAPVIRDRCIQMPRLPIGSAADLYTSSQRVVNAVTDGKIPPNDGESLTNILEGHRKIIETVTLDGRVTEIEAELLSSDQKKAA